MLTGSRFGRCLLHLAVMACCVLENVPVHPLFHLRGIWRDLVGR